MSKLFAIVVILIGALFIALDLQYSEMISTGVRGELWGPVSWFHPVVKWLWIGAVALLCWSVLFGRKRPRQEWPLPKFMSNDEAAKTNKLRCLTCRWLSH